MDFGFEAEGITAIFAMIAIVVLPIKAGAHMVGARNTNFGACVVASIVGIVSAALASSLIGGSIGSAAAGFLGFIFAIRYVLGTTLIGSVVLSIVAVFVGLISSVVLSGIL